MFLAVVLCFFMIHDIKDFKKLAAIYVWQAAIICFFIILEYYSDFNIAFELGRTNPNYTSDIHSKAANSIFRSGFYRVSGIDGNAVMTGYRLSFYFPLLLWYVTRKRLIFISVLPLLLICVSLIMLQTRAAFVAIIVATIYLLIEMIYYNKMNISKRFGNLGKILILFSLTSLIIFTATPTIRTILSTFFYDSLNPFDMTSGYNIQGKLDRIPRAWYYFQQHPIIGYGSPQNAYFQVMKTDDIPAPLIYLLAGGIPLALVYLSMLLYMPYSVFMYSKTPLLSDNMKTLLLFASASFVAGVVVVFSNYQETHFMIMYMLYISIYKVFSPGVKKV